MDIDIISQLSRQAVVVAAQVAGPVLLAALAVGVLFAILQAVTQVHEQSMSHVPKIVAVGALIFALMPWFLGVLSGYARHVFEGIGGLPW